MPTYSTSFTLPLGSAPTEGGGVAKLKTLSEMRPLCDLRALYFTTEVKSIHLTITPPETGRGQFFAAIVPEGVFGEYSLTHDALAEIPSVQHVLIDKDNTLRGSEGITLSFPPTVTGHLNGSPPFYTKAQLLVAFVTLGSTAPGGTLYINSRFECDVEGQGYLFLNPNRGVAAPPTLTTGRSARHLPTE